MELHLIHTYKKFWSKNGRYGVEIERFCRPKITCWLSEKQFEKLRKSFDWRTAAERRVFGVFEGERFVWCGVDTPRYSELPYLKERFGVDITDAYRPDPHLDNLKNPVAVEHDDLKN